MRLNDDDLLDGVGVAWGAIDAFELPRSRLGFLKGLLGSSTGAQTSLVGVGDSPTVPCLLTLRDRPREPSVT